MINAWFEREGCVKVIKESLGKQMCTGISLPLKLKKVKEALKTWNAAEDDLNSRVKVLEKRINEIVGLGDLGDLDSNIHEELIWCKLHLRDSLKAQENLWKQKSRINWLKHEDLNTKFFHRAVKIRSRRNKIYGQNLGLGREASPKRMKQLIWEDTSLNMEFKRLEQMDTEMLELQFTMEEIKEAVWRCGDSKAPGPDGFKGMFFKKCWDMVEEDLLEILENFNTSGKLPQNINSSFIALISKTTTPANISEYMPTSLIS
ncbi:uncharacterized protein LOC120116942 [Hibiscus syriacus]|uniref:uncharacterized protein LOC120116942 n=1 Tax=Hibiscus syriacus TaxID=106335 RepID=UPI001921C95F|nr:uncharacterized protein LOC120116942 [Hibiscus syriacus]